MKLFSIAVLALLGVSAIKIESHKELVEADQEPSVESLVQAAEDESLDVDDYLEEDDDEEDHPILTAVMAILKKDGAITFPQLKKIVVTYIKTVP